MAEFIGEIGSQSIESKAEPLLAVVSTVIRGAARFVQEITTPPLVELISFMESESGSIPNEPKLKKPRPVKIIYPNLPCYHRD